MADTPKPTTPAQGDGSTDDSTPGIPDPNPTLPDASVEPAAQVASAAASGTLSEFAPPAASDYEMPDDYATGGTLDKIKAWAEAHPGLAVLAAAGSGLLIGRIVTGLFPDPEPASLAKRVEKKAKVYKKEAEKQSKVLAKEAKKQGKVLAKEAKKQGKVFGKEAKKQGKQFRAQTVSLTDDATDSLQDLLHRASVAFQDATHTAGDAAEDGYEKTKDFAEHVSEAVASAVKSKIDDWGKR